jgi:hypothetical protein
MKIINRVVATLLIIVGVIGLALSTEAVGDIGLSIMIASIIGILSGIGFWTVPSK